MVKNIMLRTKRESDVHSNVFWMLGSDPPLWDIVCGVHLKVPSMAVCTSHTHKKKFPGYKAPDSKGEDAEFDAEAHKEKIMGSRVKEYMEMMQEEDPTKYEEAHGKIRENPVFEPKERDAITYTRGEEGQ